MSALAFIGVFFVSVFFAWGFNRLTLVPWRRAAGLHWTERARSLYPARRAASLTVFLIPFFFALVHVLLLPRHPLLVLATACAAWAGALLGQYPFESLLYPWLNFRSWLFFVSTGWLLRLVLWLPIVAAAILMPNKLGWLAWAMVAGVGALLTAFNCGAGLWLCRWLHLILPPPEQVQRIVTATAGRMQVKVRKLWLMRGATANAVAFPTTHELVFTERLLAVCTDEELAAICGHELGHLTESPWTVAGRLLAALAVLPWLFIQPAIASKNPYALMLVGFSSLSILWLGRRLARRMEVRADRVAVTHSDPVIYTRALEKIYEANQLPVVMPGKRQIHPHFYDRMLAAGLTPAYPRPAPPSQWLYGVLVLLLVLLVMALVFATNFFAAR